MRASEVTPRPVEWLWHPFMPLGKLTVAAGQMGQGKSLLTAWMAAQVTNGTLHGPRGDVLILSAEDDPEDTIRPRLEAAGADLDRVWIEPAVELDRFLLEAACDQMGDVRLITIDPIQAYLGAQVNSWKGQDVRRALEPIRQLAADRHLAVLLVQHLNRRTDAGDPLARIADSQGIPQLARSVLVWGPDPQDPEGDHGSTKALTRAKGNLARAQDSATFSIVEKPVNGSIKAPALERGADRHISADDVVADRETRTAQDEAVAWLRALLEEGPVPAKEATRKAREDGISERTLRRARKAARVRTEQDRGENGISGWLWRLDDPVNPNGHLGHLGHLPQAAKVANPANMSKGSNVIPLVDASDDEEDRAAAFEARHRDVVA